MYASRQSAHVPGRPGSFFFYPSYTYEFSFAAQHVLRFRHGRGPGAYHAFLNHAVVDAIRSGSCDTSTEIEPAASSRSYSRRVRTNGIETTSSTVSAARQCNEKTGGYCDPFERVRLRISPVYVYLANFQIPFHRDSHEKILLYIFDVFCRPFAPIQS